MNKQNRNKPIDTENMLMVARQESVVAVGEKVEGIKITGTNYQLRKQSLGCKVA